MTDNTPNPTPDTDTQTTAATTDAPELDYSYELEEGTVVEFYR